MTGWTRTEGWGVVDRPDAGDHGGRLYAAPLRSGEITVLEGPAAVVARAALAGADLDHVREAAAAGLGVPPGTVDVDVVEELLGELVRLGLLSQVAARL